MVLRLLTVLCKEVQLATLAAGHLIGLVLQLVFSVKAGFDTAGEVHFLLGVQQGDLTDLLEVVLHRVGCCAGNRHLLDGFVGLIGIGDDEATLDVDAVVRAFTKCGALSELRILFLRFVLRVSFFFVDGLSIEFGVLKVLASRLEVFVDGLNELLDGLLDDLFFLLLATARLLRGGLLRRFLFGGAVSLLRGLLGGSLLRGSLLLGLRGAVSLLRRLLSSRLLRGSLLLGLRGAVSLLRRLLSSRLLCRSLRLGICSVSNLLRGSLLRRGLLRGRLLFLGGSARRVDRGGTLLGARGLLRGGLHLRGFLSRRGVLCRSARCTHTGPFH